MSHLVEKLRKNDKEREDKIKEATESVYSMIVSILPNRVKTEHCVETFSESEIQSYLNDRNYINFKTWEVSKVVDFLIEKLRKDGLIVERLEIYDQQDYIPPSGTNSITVEW